MGQNVTLRIEIQKMHIEKELQFFHLYFMIATILRETPQTIIQTSLLCPRLSITLMHSQTLRTATLNQTNPAIDQWKGKLRQATIHISDTQI